MSPTTISGPHVLLVRHGETEWSRTGRHTGRTDLDLTPHGEDQARALAPVLGRLTPAAVMVSPLTRARRTAELAGLTGVVIDDDLQEWDYGDVEGITTQDWQAQGHPGWNIWADGSAGGESVEDVGARADRALGRVQEFLDDGSQVVVVAHGHFLRVLAARWLGLESAAGALLRLDPATLSALGYEHDQHVILQWNAPA